MGCTADITQQGCTQPLLNRVKVVGVGSCGVDYLASVAQFPKPDDKLRTEKLEVCAVCKNCMDSMCSIGCFDGTRWVA